MNSILEKYCSPEWHELIAYHSDIRLFKAGELIFDIGEKTTGLYFINEGKVKVLTAAHNNTQRIIRLATNDDILGHRGFGGSWTYSIAAIALTDTELTFIPMGMFNKLVKGNPEFGYFMMMFFAEELRDSERLAKQMPVKNAVASVIYQLYKVFGFEKGSTTRLSFTLSRKDIASKAGTTYESVVRVIGELNKGKIIKIEGKHLHILDLEQLRSLAEGN